MPYPLSRDLGVVHKNDRFWEEFLDFEIAEIPVEHFFEAQNVTTTPYLLCKKNLDLQICSYPGFLDLHFGTILQRIPLWRMQRIPLWRC